MYGGIMELDKHLIQDIIIQQDRKRKDKMSPEYDEEYYGV